jgi:hypothetical protein
MNQTEYTCDLFKLRTGESWEEKSRSGPSVGYSEKADTIRSDISELSAKVETLLNRPNKWNAQIRDLGEEGYLLRESIQIVIEEYSDESVIARFPEIDVFGEGQNESEAISNLKLAILDIYDELVISDPNSLGRIPQMWLRILNQLIVKS